MSYAQLDLSVDKTVFVTNHFSLLFVFFLVNILVYCFFSNVYSNVAQFFLKEYIHSKSCNKLSTLNLANCKLWTIMICLFLISNM